MFETKCLSRAMVACSAVSVILVLFASPVSAALIHNYRFATSGSVIDSVGGANGALVGGASVSGGALHLDGATGWVQFGAALVPTGANPYSVFVRVNGEPDTGRYAEIISQGYSTGPGFYIGTKPGGDIRLTDNFGPTSISFPSGTHDLLLASGPGGTNFYIDSVLQFSSLTQAMIGTGGDPTVFGRQFFPDAEFFKGDISALRIYNTVITPDAVPESAAWSLMLLGFGLAGAAVRARRANWRCPA